jgi:hypothetical protein
MLDVDLSEQGLLASLQLDKLLIHKQMFLFILNKVGIGLDGRTFFMGPGLYPKLTLISWMTHLTS